MNPKYQIYSKEMYETSGTDGIICQSPNETILFKDEKELNNFIKLVKENNFEKNKNWEI